MMLLVNTEVVLPHLYKARKYQVPWWDSVESGQKRLVIAAHRRSGKDVSAWNICISQAIQTKGLYFYCLPLFSQARKVIWEGIEKDGTRFLDHIPPTLIKASNDTEMRIELVNGSIIRVVGADSYDRLVGSNPRGIVFSEYALQNPRAWDYLRPILTENNGWAIFISTPRGKNHFWDLLKSAKKAGWFHQTLGVNETKALTEEQIQEERNAGMSEDMIQQEYYCSFQASILGSFYSDQMKAARNENRICKVPYDSKLDVHTAWDLGITDSTVILFFQLVGKEIRIIDHEEHSGEPISFYEQLLRDKGYKYGKHYLPHDAQAKHLGTGKSIEEQLKESGIRNIHIIKALPVQDGIQAVRSIFPRLWIDERLDLFIEAINQYRREYDEKKKAFKSHPLHDWSSHSADSLRYLALALPKEKEIRIPKRKSGIYRGQ